MSAMEIGTSLVDYCNRGRFAEAIDTLYADDIESIEPPCPGLKEDERVRKGIETVRSKSVEWEKTHEVHSCKVSGPYPHEDRFAVHFDLDVTAHAGPMAGQRMQVQEVALYTVRDGQIAREEFFYAMG